MPYLHLDLPGTYPIELKRELAARLCKLYAEIMETQLWRSNVGIAELGKHNLYHLGMTTMSAVSSSPIKASDCARIAACTYVYMRLDGCIHAVVSRAKMLCKRSLRSGEHRVGLWVSFGSR